MILFYGAPFQRRQNSKVDKKKISIYLKTTSMHIKCSQQSRGTLFARGLVQEYSSVIMWTRENETKTTVWMQGIWRVSSRTKTEHFENGLTLFRPGGRRLCPHSLWTFITFFISKLNPSNLGTFPKISLGVIWHSKCLSNQVTMATTF